MDIVRCIREGRNIYELPLKVTYYARVSTDNEEQMTSIVNQVDYFVKYVGGINNWILIDGYVDEGISGKEVRKRENFMRMIKEAKDGKFNLILTKSVSRFARNTIDSIYYTNLLLDMGVGVIFINDNINTLYSDSEFRLTLMASIAQDELRKLSESVRFGLRQSINRGVVLGNDNILGYCKNRGKLSIVPEEALIVKDIYELFVSGNNNYSDIARVVNDRYNKRLNSTSIKRVLTNYKYKGYYCGRKSEVIDYKKNKRKVISKGDWVVYRDYDIVPPIIKESLWDEVNRIICDKKNTYIDLYKNKVFCELHGMVMSKGKKYKNKYYRYYICNKCFNVSNRLLDRIVGKNNIKKIIIKNDDDMKIDVFFEK